jgi:Serpin (serine protease inhibitor).
MKMRRNKFSVWIMEMVLFHFLVILPCEGLAPSDISSHLNARSLDSIHMLMDETEVIISIPSFSLEKTVNLIPLLKKVGIDDAFSSGNASFGKMVDNKGVFVNGVNQRISFRIDERGSEATSVTTNRHGRRNSASHERK